MSEREGDAAVHSSELWMWGREEALGASLYWNIDHKVLRRGEWVPDIPYACGTEAFAREEADKMSKQTSHAGENLYREVRVSGPYVSWREIWWRHRP